MADDDLIEDDLESTALAEEDLDEDALEDAELEDDDDELETTEAAEDESETEEPAEEAAPRARKKREDEDEDEDELDPDDVEADLDTILKDRIAAGEEDEEDEELEEQAPKTVGETGDGVQPKKANEFMCQGCFLLVHPAQFGPPGAMECPVGESDCPAIAQLEKQYQKARK
jgi:hypothetical protein